MASTLTLEGTIERFLYLLLGWLLGLLGPGVVDAIRQEREVISVRKALLGELHELKYRLAISAYQTDLRFGAISKPYLRWLRNKGGNKGGVAN